jgi:RloB-like protein
MPRDEKRIIRKKRANKFRTFFVIASEGRLSEPQYFRHIASFLDSTKKLGKQVKVEPLYREDNASDFRRVLSLLDDYKSKYDLKEGDQLWCLVDADKWPEKNIAQAHQLCKQKNYEFCMTNPCFELWLLLHHLDFKTLDEAEKNDLLKNPKASSSKNHLEQVLHEILQKEFGEGYRKGAISKTHLKKIPFALRQAFELEFEKNHWTFDAFCTRIHILLQQIFQTEPPDYPLPE